MKLSHIGTREVGDNMHVIHMTFDFDEVAEIPWMLRYRQ